MLQFFAIQFALVLAASIFMAVQELTEKKYPFITKLLGLLAALCLILVVCGFVVGVNFAIIYLFAYFH